MARPVPRLRPGLHVVRRDDRHLQVGLDPPWRLVVPDQPEVQRLLDDLLTGRAPRPASPEAHRVLVALDRAGMLLAGPGGPETLDPVGIQGTGALAAEVTRVLRAAGLQVDQSAALVLVVADGEPLRPDVDEQLRSGRPHLVVGGSAHGFVLGPFVVPGRTACLRCVDAHRGEHDPRRAVVVEQLAGRGGGPDDPALRGVAAAWSVRDALTYLAGGRPTTWSATVALGAELEPVRRPWARHPHCGCSWDLAAVSGHAG
jgi:hypothetical protein